MKIALPPYLTCSRGGAYLVGGSVRDLLRGARPVDYDVVVIGSPQAHAQALAGRLGTRVIAIGKERFTVYRLVAGTIQIDITAAKGRTIEEDLVNRDFTINAMAVDVADGRVIDATGGLKDLQKGVVRMVSQAVFREDPVRLIRAFRMSASLGFQLTPETARAIERQTAAIRKSASERVWGEFKQILAVDHSHSHLMQMAATGLLTAVIPQLEATRGCLQNRHHAYDVFDHSLHVVAAAEQIMQRPQDHFGAAAADHLSAMDADTAAIVKLAALVHDTGKPLSRTVDAAGRTHFYGHAKKSAAVAGEIGRQLKLSNADRKLLLFLVQNHQRPLSLFLSARRNERALPAKALGRFLRHCGRRTPLLLLHALADQMGKGVASEAMAEFLKSLMAAYVDSRRRSEPLPVNGNDLMDRFSLPPSPLIGDLLRRIEQARLAGIVRTRQEMMDWAADYLADRTH